MKNIKKLSIIAIACLTILITAFAFFHKSDVNNSDVKISDKANLPNINMVSQSGSPLLYDFINSSLGYSYDKDSFSTYGIYYAIIQNKNFNDTVFIEYYNYGDQVIYPILGYQPIKFKLKDTVIFDNYKNNLSKNRSINEGDWTVYIVSLYNSSYKSKYDYCDSNLYWGGIDLSQFNKSEHGLMYNQIFDSGLGWPTNWLRKSPFNKTVKDKGININHEFFDKYNLGSTLIFKNEGGLELKVKVTQLDRFEFEYQNNHVYLSEKQLNEFLKINNYEKRSN